MKHKVTFYDQLNGEKFVINTSTRILATAIANGLWFAKTGQRTKFDTKDLDPIISSREGFCVAIEQLSN